MFIPRGQSGRWVDPAMDDEVKVKSFRRLLPAGPTSHGGHRNEDLLEFYADVGGLRTVRVSSIIDVR